jgi:hypothetical protein
MPGKARRIRFFRTVAGACRNRTYQPPREGLNSFEDCAGHQTRTLPQFNQSKSFLLRRPSSDKYDRYFAISSGGSFHCPVSADSIGE